MNLKMQNLLPSKKMQTIIGSMLLACIIIYGGYFFATHKFFTNKKVSVEDEALIQNRVNEAITSLQKDNDNDNLKDWEETLWKTDPNNPDTDGDGRLDGEEIKTNHDPLKSSKDSGGDLLTINTSPKTTANGSVVKSPTEKLAEDFFSKYISLRSNSDSLDQTTKNDLVKSVATNDLNINLPFTTYTLKDIKIIPGEMSKAQQGKYWIKVISTLNTNETDAKEENELTILQQALDTNNKKLLDKLDPAINFYLKSAKGLLRVEVPSPMAQKHLNLINSFTQLGESISYMKQSFDEPLLILVDIKKYSVFVVNMANSLKATFTE